ncbi:hypothetical protein AAVH_23674 [Aphelenchoides avenae]|nr:hypothetical protein AAVH_23674 [Aphelenchus avenae]
MLALAVSQSDKRQQQQQRRRSCTPRRKTSSTGGGCSCTPTRKSSSSEDKENGNGAQWKCPVTSYRIDGLKVELEGDDVFVTGREVQSARDHSVSSRRLTVPREVPKTALRCYMDEYGHLSIVTKSPSMSNLPTRYIPIEFKPHAAGCAIPTR